MIEYLLEKSRVTGQGDGEQNFHIFYLFFQGYASSPEYQAGDCNDHTYLMGNETACGHAMAGPGGGGFAVTHEELMNCFKVVGFTTDQTDDIFHTLSGIVSLGDIEFTGPGGDADGDAEIEAGDLFFASRRSGLILNGVYFMSACTLCSSLAPAAHPFVFVRRCLNLETGTSGCKWS
jgi:hypothetical protein